MSKNLTEFKEINLIQESKIEVLGSYNCGFCTKTIEEDDFFEFNKKLSGDSCYCNLCIRMGWNTKNNRNCLIMSFRPIIGYFYYYSYLSEPRKMWFNNLKRLVQNHVVAGKPYPFLSYDDESMSWFVDFRKIGKDKIKVIEVEKAMIKIASTLNLQKHLIRFKQDKFNKKIVEAIQNFYTNRASAEQMVMLDFQNCCDYDGRVIDFDAVKTFCEKDLQQA